MADYFERIISLPKKTWSDPAYRRALVALLATAAVVPCITEASYPGLDPLLPGYDPDYYSVSKELARSRYVVVGQMVSEAWLGEDGKSKALQPPFQGGRP